MTFSQVDSGFWMQLPADGVEALRDKLQLEDLGLVTAESAFKWTMKSPCC